MVEPLKTLNLYLELKDFHDIVRVLALAEAGLAQAKDKPSPEKTNGEIFAEVCRQWEEFVLKGEIPTKAKMAGTLPKTSGR